MCFTRYCSIVLVAGVLACGGGGGESEGGAETSSDAAAAGVDPAQAATIVGTVSYDGQSETESIDMSAEPDCAKKHTGGASRSAVAVSNGKLSNVLVYVKSGLPQQKWPAQEKAPVLDQEGCEYHPHVLAVRANEDFVVKNSDGLLHNINAKPTTNRGFNTGQPTNMETKKRFTQHEIGIPVTCEVHGWMQSYISVLDHPFFAVTGADGSYRISGLPPGTYTVETWHEKLGTQTQQITVAAQETKQAEFSYTPRVAHAGHYH